MKNTDMYNIPIEILLMSIVIPIFYKHKPKIKKQHFSNLNSDSINQT